MNKIALFVQGIIFQRLVVGLIIFNGFLLGLETSRPLMERYGYKLLILNSVIQFLFVSEILLRIAALWPHPLRFFREGWNVFDFTVVALSLLPAAGAFAGVARLARVLRVVRIISVSPSLRLIVETTLLSIPSMAHVVLLLSLLMYIYAIVGFYLFAALDPAHWGSLGTCFLTLFQVITLEGWVELQRVLLPSYPFAWLYFVSFITIAVFVVINLFIAVVTNNLQSAKVASAESNGLQSELVKLRESIVRLETELEQFDALRKW